MLGPSGFNILWGLCWFSSESHKLTYACSIQAPATNAPLAQPGRALALHARCRWFKSSREYYDKKNKAIFKSSRFLFISFDICSLGYSTIGFSYYDSYQSINISDSSSVWPEQGPSKSKVVSSNLTCRSNYCKFILDVKV